MKYLKLFEDNRDDILYSQISISDRNFLFGSTQTLVSGDRPKCVEFRKDEIRILTDMGQSNDPTWWLERRGDGRLLFSAGAHIFYLHRLIDDWYIMDGSGTYYKNEPFVDASGRIYKCDGFDGLVQCLKDNLL